MFWTYNRPGETDEPIHIAWADPGPLAWSSPVSTGIQGQFCAPIPLADGRLLDFYVHRHAPGSMRLILSPDGGRTWDTDRELVAYDSRTGEEPGMDGAREYGQRWDEMNRRCFGHPAGLALDDGTVLLIYYGGKAKTCLSMRWSRVQV